MLEQFAVIRLRTDRYRDRGVADGTFGVIVDVYDDEAYEVEFFDLDGTSIAWFAVMKDKVELAEDLVNAAATNSAVPTA